MPARRNVKKLDVVVIVALQEEFIALFGEEKLSRNRDIPDRLGRWYRWEVEGIGAAQITFIGSMGPVDATEFTTKFLENYQPATLVNIGVSGGFSDEVVLGDVIVAELTDLYGNAGSIEDVDGVPTLRTTGKPIETADFKSMVTHFPFEEKLLYSEWQNNCAKHATNLVGTALALIPDELRRDTCHVHSGPVACASEVVKSPIWKSSILRRNRKYLAVDMESAGIANSAYESRKGGTEILIVRGISDVADERKKILDNIGKNEKGGIRRWALKNALDFMVLLLKAKHELKAPKEHLKPASEFLSADALAQLRKTFRDEAILHRLEQNPHGLLPNYERLFSFFAPGLGKTLKFDDLLTKVEATSPNGRSMSFVAGKAGSGKSTFLLCLYFSQMLRFKRGQTKLKPWFLHLRYYSEIIVEKSAEEEIIGPLSNDVRNLLSHVDAASGEGCFLLVDGSDEYYRHPRQGRVDQEFAKELSELNAKHRIFKIVSLGEGERDQFGKSGFTPSEALHWADKTELLRLQRWELTSGTESNAGDKLRPIIEAYLAVTPCENVFDTANKMIACILSLKIFELDLFTLSLIETGVRRQWDLVDGGMGVLYYNYCSEKIRQFSRFSNEPNPSSKFTLKELAKLVYELYVPDGVDVDGVLRSLVKTKPLLASLGAAIPNVHPSVKEFLIAEHAVDRLLNRDSALDPDESAIYPYGTNRFVRAIISRSGSSEREVSNKIHQIIGRTALRQKTHLCYILGRFKDASIKKDAVRLLSSTLDQIKTDPMFSDPSLINDSSECRSRLLLQRTVDISLIYLENRQAALRYLQTLMKWPICDNLNRGFHLQYYEDLPRPSRTEELIAFDDVETPPNKTFDILERKLQSDVESKRIRSMSAIELYTLCSICLNRHIYGRLEINHRLRMLNLLESSKDGEMLGFPSEFNFYIDMAKLILGSENCSTGHILCRLLALKEEPRVGWTSPRDLGDRKIFRVCPNPESVADHSWGCVVIAEIFLPENLPGEFGYSKSEVIRTLAIHDLAECFTHDKPSFDKKKADHDKEDRIMRMILSLSTLSPFANLHTSWARWEGLKNKSKGSAGINALIAADIDLIENYVQMRRYLGREGHEIPDAFEWATELGGSLMTEVCKEIWSNFRHDGANILSWFK